MVPRLRGGREGEGRGGLADAVAGGAHRLAQRRVAPLQVLGRSGCDEPAAPGGGRYLREVLGWFSGAMAGWSEQDRADLTRLLGRMVDDLTAQVDEEPS
ncbi:hypothetical protein [Pseudonocardia sp. ICBG1142]|uniref:hypothetical protein n=1 Tax=Pseudonocardia sp. ICBG1142 TaxID=2846760 RepID=UPI001CF6C6A4|nr:hypothetical protein [Pseudonocardia sp. ICBG1142]